MQIKRDYSQPFFTKSPKPRRNRRPLLFVFGVFIGSLLVFLLVNGEQVQDTALDMLGMSPTATPLPSDLATFATNLVLMGDLQQAADLFAAAVAQRPDNIDYLHEYGQLLIDMDEQLQALEIADQILELDPADPRGYALKARALVWDGNPTAAIPIATSGLDIAPDYAPLYAVLARAYANVGQYADGVAMGEKAIEIDPANVDARRSYAYALSWISANDQAITQLETALILDPNQISTHFELALQYLAQNRDQEAIDLYDRVLALQPRNARAMLRLCEAYRKVGQFERAIGYCEDATNADPTSAQAHYQLGILRYNRSDSPGGAPNFAGALESFSQCSALDPESLECKYRMGLAYHYVGECDLAWETLQESLLMAQARPPSEVVNTANEYIRLGLIAIGQACPQYSSLAPQPDVEITEAPEITPEADLNAEANTEGTN